MTSYLPRNNPPPVDRLVKENDMTPGTSFAASASGDDAGSATG
jgi:hypothetical protein